MPNVSATHLLLAALFNLVPRTFLPFRNVDSDEEKHSDKKRWGRVCVPRVSALSICWPGEKEKPWKRDCFSFLIIIAKLSKPNSRT